MRASRWGAALALFLALGGLSACGDPEFSVGDCVKIDTRVVDSALESASCDDAQGTFDPDKRIYRVDSIIEGTSGSCPELAGFFPVQFTDEPDDVIYCLVQQD